LEEKHLQQARNQEDESHRKLFLLKVVNRAWLD